LEIDVEAGLFVPAHFLRIEVRRMIAAGDPVEREGELLRRGRRRAKRERTEQRELCELHVDSPGRLARARRVAQLRVTDWRNVRIGPRRCQRMGTNWTDWPADVLAVLRRGAVIPAHP